MGKVVKFPQPSGKSNVVEVSRQYAMDLAQHRRKLVKLQEEIRRLKRGMLRLAHAHEPGRST